MSSHNNGQGAFYMIAMGGMLGWSGLKRYFRARKVEDSARSQIASAAQGHVEVEGFAWPSNGQTIDCLNGDKAVHRQILIERKVKRGKNSHWETVWSSSFEPGFFVVDETGLALVMPIGAELEVKKQVRGYSRLSPLERDRLAAEIGGPISIGLTGVFPPGTFGGIFNEFRVTEASILLGAPMYAEGHFSSPGVNATFDKRSLDLFRAGVRKLGWGRRANLSVLDLNRDGTICEDETRYAYVTQAKQVLAGGAAAAAQTTSVPGLEARDRVYGLLQSSEINKLYLADCFEEHLIRRVGSWNFLRIVGGIALIVLGLIILTGRL